MCLPNGDPFDWTLADRFAGVTVKDWLDDVS
jgi:hypothetical protein